MSGSKMIAVDGVFYTPEDLAAKEAREAAAAERAEREAAKVLDHVEANLDEAALAAVVAPLLERIDALENLVGESIQALGERIGKCEDAHEAADNAAGGTEVPAEGSSAASEAAGAGSDDAKAAKGPGKAGKGAAK